MYYSKILLASLVFFSFTLQAEYAVGYFYLKNGQPEKAYREFRELAEVGYAFYMNMIADMHLRGQGVAVDPVLAHVWYSLSAAQDNAEGIRGKKAVAKKLNRSQLQQSKKMAHEYAELYLQPYVAGWSLQ